MMRRLRRALRRELKETGDPKKRKLTGNMDNKKLRKLQAEMMDFEVSIEMAQVATGEEKNCIMV